MHECAGVGDMLDKLQREEGVEAPAGERLDRGAAIVDVEAGRLGVRARNGDGFRFRVDRGDGRAQSPERLRHKAASASRVQQVEPGQGAGPERVATETVGDPVPHPADPHRIQGVQRLEPALRIPPFIRNGGEPPGLFRVQGRAGFGHRNLFQAGGRNMLRPPAGGKPLQALEGCSWRVSC